MSSSLFIVYPPFLCILPNLCLNDINRETRACHGTLIAQPCRLHSLSRVVFYIIHLLALAMVFRALPFLNHSIWPALKVWDSLTSKGLPSLGLTTMVMGLPGASSVALISTCCF